MTHAWTKKEKKKKLGEWKGKKKTINFLAKTGKRDKEKKKKQGGWSKRKHFLLKHAGRTFHTKQHNPQHKQGSLL